MIWKMNIHESYTIFLRNLFITIAAYSQEY